ncbi:zinc-binding dehydrogenase [Aerophototrophica crusticola]|uniref:Zinc-binding dehydrogenase n=1 Tax=Aerophototrophica crusticola TaxID=1709002 RepID=A0A858R6M0_9PROT|nr:zinc-binding dehydrogenase [Rhodospirillaceae bacterium B3]
MKAAILRAFGAPEVLTHGDLPTPEPGPGEVLVKILAAGMNRLDHYLRSGVRSTLPLPHVLGSDAAGVVEALGPGVTGFRSGDRVIPMPGYPTDPAEAAFQPMTGAPSYAIRGAGPTGTYAQYMTIPARWLLRDDTGLPPEQVATLPMVVATGVRAVKVVGEVKPGDAVLVHAGASGTGSMNVQVAKALGARVAATVRTPDKAGFVRDLGADLVVPLDGFGAAILDWTGGRGVDVVIDNLGGEVLTNSLDVLAPLGRLVSMGFVMGTEACFPLRPFFFGQKQIRGTLMGDRADLEWGLAQVTAGHLRPTLDRTYPLSEAAAAHARLAAGEALGTIVLLPWG